MDNEKKYYDGGLNWNASIWSEKFNSFSNKIKESKCMLESYPPDPLIQKALKSVVDVARSAIRDMRVDVFKHTVKIVRAGKYMTEDGRDCVIAEADVREMQEGTKFYSVEFRVDDIPTQYETEVEVANVDCLKAARMLQEQGYNVAVLNMASRRNPGGGVYTGAGAQEENLFRRTNLFQSMYQFADFASQYGVPKSAHQYPLDRNFGGVYTPNAYVIRGEENNGYPVLADESADLPSDKKRFKMSFIAVPGMNRPDLTADGMIVDSLVEPIKNKIRTIFRIGLQNGHDALVLGALGCGAFRNPPRHIARLFHEVMEEKEFKNKYKKLCFAILEDHNSGHSHNPEGNYEPFLREFCRMD